MQAGSHKKAGIPLAAGNRRREFSGPWLLKFPTEKRITVHCYELRMHWTA